MSEQEWLEHLDKMQMHSTMSEEEWINRHGVKNTWNVNYDKDQIIRGIFRQFREQKENEDE